MRECACVWWCSVEVIRDRDWVTEVQEGWKVSPPVIGQSTRSGENGESLGVCPSANVMSQ